MSRPRPNVKEGIGEKPQFKQLKLETKSEVAGEFTKDKSCFSIDLKSDKSAPVKTIHQLKHYDDNLTETDVPNAVFIEQHDEIITLNVAVDKTGWFKLNIFAAPKAEQSSSLPCVYTYLFEVKKAKDRVFPYPKQFADWTDKCILHKPLYLDPCKCQDDVEFEVTIPGADKVAVTADGEWTQLRNVGGDRWKAPVRLSHHFQKPGNIAINVNANMGGEDLNTYPTLLQYCTKP